MLVQKRNDHSHSENMEGNLKGEVIIEKLDDTFDLLSQTKRVKLASSIEEYIDFEIEARQQANFEILSKGLFQEIGKLVVKPIGFNPTSQ